MPPLRPLLFIGALLLVLAGVVLSAGPARLTLVNDGLRVDYPWPRAAAAWVAVSGAVAAGALIRRLWARVLLACLALLALQAAWYLSRFRLDANDLGIAVRGAGRTHRLSWSQVARVETGPGIRALVGPGDRRASLDITDLLPADVAALDRTIARRLSEAGRR